MYIMIWRYTNKIELNRGRAPSKTHKINLKAVIWLMGEERKKKTCIAKMTVDFWFNPQRFNSFNNTVSTSTETLLH